MAQPVTQEQLIQDPHPIYAKLREDAPVSPMQMMTFSGRGWVVTGYAEAREAFTHPALSRDGNKYFGALDTGLDERVRAAMNHHMLNSDPPDHTRLRRMVVKVFTARRIAALAPRITEIATELLDAVKPGASLSTSSTLLVSHCRSGSSASCSASRRGIRTPSANGRTSSSPEPSPATSCRSRPRR
ncbi:cytochrome P450 family protein [Fodinicola feengrottensis]|uniref:hypothetical protein n=1 Tax=Fodinicola feengrottensis TaxID=435914 RepID=UPI0024418CDF|nr:hypothetical protein [Fodinicola feengrottensis]